MSDTQVECCICGTSLASDEGLRMDLTHREFGERLTQFMCGDCWNAIGRESVQKPPCWQKWKKAI